MAIEAGFSIGAREVFPSEGRIAGPAGDLRVEPKAMAVLVELARRAPDVCPREQLIAAVWPRGFVSDDVLIRCIGQLRRALGDNPRTPACLETIPKRGYRLMAPVHSLEGRRRAPPGDVESLLVLPFQNLSAAGDDFVADGLTELLILRLAALRGMRVISRTTAMQFKGSRVGISEIGHRTGADWVVEGSVFQSADRLQVVVQLIDVRTDAHIWADDYVRDLEELVPLLNEIARRVAAAIRHQLGVAPEPPRSDTVLPPAVVRRYLRGRHLLSRRTLPALTDALAEFRSVTSDVPTYAQAWASLAECQMLLAHYGAAGTARLVAQCERGVERALTLDSDLAIALSARGGVRFFFRYDLSGANEDLRRALDLLPSHVLAMVSLANVCAVRHDFDEADAWLEQALLVDPLDVGVNMNIGDHRILQRRYLDAVSALESALALVPRHRPSELRLAWALSLSGDAVSARRVLDGIVLGAAPDAQWHEYAALVAGAEGDPVAAGVHAQALEHLAHHQRVAPWSLARAAAAAGRADAAIEHLERAAASNSSSVPFMRVTPAFDGVRADPRFRTLAARLGLPESPQSADR
jgi:TolB-like protein